MNINGESSSACCKSRARRRKEQDYRDTIIQSHIRYPKECSKPISRKATPEEMERAEKVTKYVKLKYEKDVKKFGAKYCPPHYYQ